MEVACFRRGSVFDVADLALADLVHNLDAGDQDPGATNGLETERQAGDSFDGAVVILDEVVQAILTWRASMGRTLSTRMLAHGCRVRAAHVIGDLLRHAA